MAFQNCPLVSVALPLYRSAAFLESIKSNLQAVNYPNVEIFISDRHCYDDTIGQLEEFFSGDSRFTFFAETDELDWVSHFNFLLRQGSGKYFRWMPHDDNFPSCDLASMVRYLESYPESVLIWGPTEHITLDGRSLGTQEQPRPCANPPWTFDISVLLNFDEYCNGAFKGLFRRDVVERHGLYISATYQLQYSERCWLFAMSLLGNFYFSKDYHYQKRLYPTSTHAQWKTRIPNIISQCWTMQKYLIRLPNTPRNKLVGTIFLAVLTCRKITIVLSNMLRISPSGTKWTHQRLASRAMFSDWILWAASKPPRAITRPANDSKET